MTTPPPEPPPVAPALFARLAGEVAEAARMMAALDLDPRAMVAVFVARAAPGFAAEHAAAVAAEEDLATLPEGVLRLTDEATAAAILARSGGRPAVLALPDPLPPRRVRLVLLDARGMTVAVLRVDRDAAREQDMRAFARARAAEEN